MVPFTFAGMYREAARGWPAEYGHGAWVVIYTLFRSTYFVVNGLEKGKVFYQRMVYSRK